MQGPQQVSSTEASFHHRIRAEREVQLQQSTANAPRASTAGQSLTRLQHLIGSYSHPAYGRYEICPPPSSSLSIHCAESDSHWSEVIKANASTFTSSVGPVLGAAITAGGANFMTLTHLKEDVFAASFFDIYISPPGASTAPVVVVPQFDRAPNVEFSVGSYAEVEGFAFTGGAWGQGAGVPSPKGRTVKERAEVWFERL